MPEYNPPVAHYAHFKVDQTSIKGILRAIGKNGCRFKELTEKLNLKYLWWNKDLNIIEVWGGEHAVEHGMPKVKKFVEYHANEA